MGHRFDSDSSVLMSVMMLAFSVSQTAGPIIAITKAAAAATDFFAVIDAPKPDMTGLSAPEVSSTEDIVFDSITFACTLGLPQISEIPFGPDTKAACIQLVTLLNTDV